MKSDNDNIAMGKYFETDIKSEVDSDTERDRSKEVKLKHEF